MSQKRIIKLILSDLVLPLLFSMSLLDFSPPRDENEVKIKAICDNFLFWS